MKVIITDLDRTLLHTDKTISDYTIQIMQECRKQGIFLMAATARPVRAIKQYMRAVHFNAVTTLNGARTILMDRSVDYSIDKKNVLSLIESLMAVNDIVISLETDEGIISNIDIPEWNPTVYENLLTAPIPDTIYKMIISSEGTNLDTIIPSLVTDDVYCSVADGKLYQIMSSQATKWNGIKCMLEEFGLSVEDAIYFGDDNDDIEPLMKCGTGVAVANSIPAALEAADTVTLSNDEDGVAEYVKKLLEL